MTEKERPVWQESKELMEFPTVPEDPLLLAVLGETWQQTVRSGSLLQ